MPLAVRFRKGKHRLVELGTGGVALGANGKPLDQGGGKGEGERKRLAKQATAVNLSKMEEEQRIVEAQREHAKNVRAVLGRSSKRASMKEDALPVLKLAGIGYGIQLAEAGMPAALVVEKPDDYAGKEFRYASGDGFRSVRLGEAAGPYRNLMSLPPHVLHGLDSARLRELGESRELYLVELTESALLKEDDDGPVVEVAERLRGRGIGKRMGAKLYVHFSALTEADTQALNPIMPEGFEWNVVKLHEDTGAATFINSPDFDTADEPVVGDSILVKPGGELREMKAGDDPMIYHHKWQFVEETYEGFSVEESKARSAKWEALEDVDRSRIGKRSFWRETVVPRLREAVEVLTDADRELVAKAMGHRTAIARKGPSVPLRFYQEHGLLEGEVLDYGGGQDVHDFARWDPHYAPDPAPLLKRYDTVMCNYVLNVTPIESLRSQVLSALRGLLKDGGRCLVSCWQKQKEDVQTSSSFQSGWDAARWQEFFKANGWEAERLKTSAVMAWSLRPAGEEAVRAK